jgi:hypothetical protein
MNTTFTALTMCVGIGAGVCLLHAAATYYCPSLPGASKCQFVNSPPCTSSADCPYYGVAKKNCAPDPYYFGACQGLYGGDNEECGQETLTLGCIHKRGCCDAQGHVSTYYNYGTINITTLFSWNATPCDGQ